MILNEQKNLIVLGVTILFFAIIIASDFLSESNVEDVQQAAATSVNVVPEIPYVRYPFEIKVLDSRQQKITG